MSEADSGELPLFSVPGWVIVIIIFVALAFWSWLDAVSERDILIRQRVAEGASISNPHRTAIGIACTEKALRAGTPRDELGLAAPAEYHGEYVKSVALEVESETKARVIIAYRAISTVIREGDTVVYSATCPFGGGVTWEIGGTVPKKYRPKQ